MGQGRGVMQKSGLVHSAGWGVAGEVPVDPWAGWVAAGLVGSSGCVGVTFWGGGYPKERVMVGQGVVQSQRKGRAGGAVDSGAWQAVLYRWGSGSG